VSFYKHMKYSDGSGDLKMGPFSSRKDAVDSVLNSIVSQQRITNRTFMEHGESVWTATDGSVEIWIEEH